MAETRIGVTAPPDDTISAGQERVHAQRCFAAAGVLVFGVYLSELFHLLEEPLFSRIYYGNLNAAFFGVFSAVYIFVFVLLLHRKIRAVTGVNVFSGRSRPLSLGRKAVLYVMTAAPVLLTAVWLDMRFKLVYELGERITGMTLLGNVVGYFLTAAKLFAAVYFIFLVEAAAERFAAARWKLPVGGVAAALFFGVLEYIFEPSMFSLLYVFLFFYCGVIAIVSEKRFGVTYALSLILYIM